MAWIAIARKEMTEMTVMQDDTQVVRCEGCSAETAEPLFFPTHGDRGLCRDCEDRSVWCCEYCSETFDTCSYDPNYITESGEIYESEIWCCSCTDRYAYYCEECDAYHRDGPCSRGLDGIHDYGYKPHAVFHGEPTHYAYFGVEIEMESRDGCGQDALNYFMGAFTHDEFYYKHDGSIYSEDGFEMVSHPRSLDSWQSLLPRLQDAMRYARRVGMRSWNTDTCGIHVHIDARTFGGSSAHLYRFTQFIYRNERPLTRVAGRGSVSYSRYFSDPDNRRIILVADIKDRKRYGGAGERYMAINLCNRNTIEVRMFRGSLNAERIVANIEFLHALVEYTREMTTQDAYAGGMKFDVFAHWALMRRDTYPSLASLILDKFDMANA